MPTIQKTKRIFEFIKGTIIVNGESPTIKEIREAFNMRSPASVHQHLRKMEQMGWIEIIPNISRGVRVLNQERKEAA